MDKKIFDHITSLDKYLQKREKQAENAFKSIADKITKRQPSFVLLHFTYENIEVGLKYDSEFEFIDDFDGVISNDEIDEFDKLKVNHEDPYEELLWANNYDLRVMFIKTWLTKCFKQSKVSGKVNCPFYFKYIYEQMEILNLATGRTFYERNEFERWFKNNEENKIDVYVEE